MNRKGVALVLVLLAMLVTAALAAGVLAATSTDARTSGDSRLAVRATEAAERGHLSLALAWSPESNLTMPQGATLSPVLRSYADSTTSTAQITRLTRGSFWLTATGRGGTAAGVLPVERRVGVLYTLHVPEPRLTAALNVRDSLLVAGAAVVSGSDTAPSAWGGFCLPGSSPVAAVAAPDTSRVCDGTCGTVGGRLVGTPPKLLDSAAALASGLTQLGSVTWTSLVAHATHVFPTSATVTPAPRLTGAVCDTTASTNWGDPSRSTPCRNRFVIVHAVGDLVIDGGLGQGVILGEGDVELRNGAQFMGVILARDDLVALTGANQLWGAAIAGDARRAPSDYSVIAGATAVTYSSCAVDMALLGTARLRREAQRGWMPGH